MPDPLETYIDRLDMLLSRADTLVENGVRLKTIAQVTRRYGDALDRFVREGLRTRDKVDFRRAHKALLRSGVAREAYIEGVREAGGSAEDLDDDDDEQIAAWVSDQLSFVD